MIQANELKSGVVVEINRAPHIIESVQKQSPSARGAATLYKVRARNLISGQKSDAAFRGDDVLVTPEVQTIQCQYLYKDDSFAFFLDLESFEQHEVSLANLEHEMQFLTEGLEGIYALLLEDKLVSVRLPDSVELAIVETGPALKGASATARTKPAITVTGLKIQVPEYMENGEIVRVETSEGRFLGRA